MQLRGVHAVAREAMANEAKKRRKYLQDKSTLGLFRGIGGIVASGSAALVLIVLMFAPAGWDHNPAHLFCLVLLVGVARIGADVYVSCGTEAKALPYVPPVSEQIAALSADEVLLRASHTPSAASDDLLKPAQQGAETACEELLRPTYLPTSVSDVAPRA